MTAAAATTAPERLLATEGYEVETPRGAIGRVEEIWVGPDEEPLGLAVRTIDGGHALLPAEQVRAVERGRHWIVARDEPTLLELVTPRATVASAAGETRIAARWTTTGALLPPPSPRPRARLLRRLRRPVVPVAAEKREVERPLWQTVAVLYSVVVLVVVVVLALAFLVPLIVEGSAY